MSRHVYRGPWRAGLAVMILIGLGSIGLSRFEGVPYSEGFYQAILTMLSHHDHYGFSDPYSRYIVILLIIGSLSVLAYLIKWFAEYMIGISASVKRKRMKAKIAKLKDHTIVCGLGRVGSQVAKELYREKVPFVALDRDPGRVEFATSQGYLALQLDSTNEEALKEAGIVRAQTLISCLGEDSHNLFVTLAARAFNPDLFIVARVDRTQNEQKLKNAGADRVAHPYKIGGYYMANMGMRANLMDYMDIVTNTDHDELKVEEMEVGKDSKLAGHSLSRMLMEGSEGATVIAINGHDGNTIVRPKGKEVIYPGDKLIMLGTKDDLEEAGQLVR